MMGQFWADVRSGARQILRAPGISLAVIAALGLGIGANTALFSVVDGVLLRPLEYRDGERLVMLWERNDAQGLEHQELSPVNFVDYADLKQVFTDAAGWWRPDLNLTDESGEPIRVRTIETSANIFQVVGVDPLIGPGFEEGDDAPDHKSAIVIDYGLWQSRYGGDPGVIGKPVQLDARPFTIKGVMPPGFSFPGETQVWMALTWQPERHSRAAHFFESVARLKEGVTLQQAQSELDALSRRLAEENPRTNRDWTVQAVALRDELVGSVRPALLLLLGAVALVLLIACANIANLLLARGAARGKEIAVRAAMGAGRARILRLLLTESVLLALAGGLAGLALAWAALRSLVGLVPVDIPRLDQASLDWRVLAFSLGLSLLTGLVFGSIPAWRASRRDLQPLLQSGTRGSSGTASSRLRGALVVGEMALATMLLAGSGLLLQSFLALMQEDPGFRHESVSSINVQLPRRAYPESERVAAFFRQLTTSLRENSALRQVAATSFLPFDSGWRVPYEIEGRSYGDANDRPQAQHVTVTPGYFETMGIPLLKGRVFEESDQADTQAVIVINQAMAEQMWPGEDPLDEVITSYARGFGPLGTTLIEDSRYRIAGVVADVKNRRLTEAAEPTIYYNYGQFPYRDMHLVVRSSLTHSDLRAVTASQVRSQDASLPVGEVRPLQELVAGSVSRPRFLLQLLTAFAALAMLMAALGIYGVLSFNVRQRRQEIGVRLALGAGRGDVVRLVVRQGLQWSVLGLLLGIGAAYLLARSLAGLLYGVQPADPLTLAATAAILLACALAASYLPARRATSIDPLLALRSD
ncbi:MAG TPA: ABC transporter permease [Acidobacteriota bacterium]|nr:ABC transporter permease [Acidobacteriota bacterium]